MRVSKGRSVALAGVVVVVCLLAACSHQPNDEMATVYSMEMAPAAAELGYANKAGHSPAVLAQLEAYRQQAWAEVQAIAKEHAADPTLDVYSTAGYAALVKTIAALNAYEKAHGVAAAKGGA